MIFESREGGWGESEEQTLVVTTAPIVSSSSSSSFSSSVSSIVLFDFYIEIYHSMHTTSTWEWSRTLGCPSSSYRLDWLNILNLSRHNLKSWIHFPSYWFSQSEIWLLVAPCTLHPVPCTPELCVRVKQETLAADLWGARIIIIRFSVRRRRLSLSELSIQLCSSLYEQIIEKIHLELAMSLILTCLSLLSVSNSLSFNLYLCSIARDSLRLPSLPSSSHLLLLLFSSHYSMISSFFSQNWLNSQDILTKLSVCYLYLHWGWGSKS